MSTNRDELRAKIARLMAMGNDPRTNEFEAEAALRHASALMRKHAIEQAEIADAAGEKPRYDWITAFVAANPDRPQTTTTVWLGQLAYGVSKFTDVRAIWKRDPSLGYGVELAGDAVDVNYADYLLRLLRDTVRRESARFAGSRTERETFRRAMVGRLIERMKAIKAEQRSTMQAESGGGRALVLVDNKIAERDARFGAQGSRRVTQRRRVDAFAASAGHAAGDRVGFGRPVGHNTRALAAH